LTARWTPEGKKGEIWLDVRKTFEDIEVIVGGKKHGYRLGWDLVRAKDYGVPQNRPRVLLVGIRDDLNPSIDETLPAEGFLPAPTLRPPSPAELLGDLVDPDWQPGGATLRYPSKASAEIQNMLRLDRTGSRVARKGDPVTEHEYSRHRPKVIEKFQHMIDSGGAIPEDMKTKKFAQRVLPTEWGPNGPSITATSLPDDYVHFSQPRVLTVREWARLQLFPDWYEFVGKRTTGGRRRAGDPSAGQWTRDLPKYTQIGNAVPTALARAVGEHITLLSTK
jgi:DNA (cytosine-5)-methyltransferase 1